MSVVVDMFDAMQARDWERVAERVHPDAFIDFAHTGERFNGDGFVAMNRDYPEGWSLAVTPLVECDAEAVVNVVVEFDDTIFDCVAAYTVVNGSIMAGREWWVERGQQPPEWRRPYLTER